jgi:Spy/CpxP family protein refolding chaperone
MRIAHVPALSLLAALVVFAPAWAQDAQQAPPAPPALPAPGGPGFVRGRMFFRSGPGGGPQGVMRGGRGMMGPGPGRMASRNRVFVRRFRPGMAGMRGGPMAGPRMGLDRIANDPNLRQQLGITDAQAAKIRQQATDLRIAGIRSRADLQVDQLQLRNLLTAENPDRAAINQKLDQISAAQLAQRKQEVSSMLAMRDVLTPEQRQKLQQLRQAPVRRGGRGTAAPSTAPPPPAQPNP